MRCALSALFFLAGCGSFGLDEGPVALESEPLISIDPDGDIVFEASSPSGRSQSEEVVVMSLGGVGAYVANVWVESTTEGVFFTGEELPFPKLMEAGEEIPITVRFQPTAAGTFHGVLVVETGTDGSILERALLGNGCRDSDADGNC